MKRKFVACNILSLILICMFCSSSLADTGPKPSVRIKFENLTTNNCWGTLLSEDESTGPASAWNGVAGSEQFNDNEEIWRAFQKYKDSDGYYFLQEFWDCGESKSIDWTYYPPENFKILLYFPETGEYAVSEKCERYAFHSYFTADVAEMKTIDVTQDLTGGENGNENGSFVTDENDFGAVDRSYNYTAEIVSFFARLLICIGIEMIIALLFEFRGKKLLLLILFANAGTQLFLNIALSVLYYRCGGFTLVYFLLEIIVLAAETAVYTIGFKRIGRSDIRKIYIVLYTLVANTVSFAAGLILSKIIPDIF